MAFGLSVISTHTPLAGCDPSFVLAQTSQLISTHTPLAGCDYLLALKCKQNSISTHTPLAGCDIGLCSQFVTAFEFQLTHPSRGATCLISPLKPFQKFQLTHPSRGATNGISFPVNRSCISTHTPLAGCDALSCKASVEAAFQLTHPSRGATGIDR